jgi:outer membrane cobalamin receptor
MTPTSRAARWWALLAALSLATPVASADSRADARRHFQSGMGAVAAGRYDEGIAELLAAYRIRPHPAVLYNIGRAYQDAGDAPKAIEYLRQYLSYDPPDADAVRARVVALEASSRPAEPQPPVVTAPAVKPPAGRPGPVDEDTQARISALLDRLDAAVARAESIGASATPATAATPAATTPGVEQSEAREEVLQNRGDAYEEVVVTASRYAQNALQAPAATTTITADEIALSGATTLPELLRRVPGIDVMRLGVGSSDVSIRGFNQRVSNKLLVLVDGRSVYEDFLGLTLFDELPIALEEIARVEIIRGPGSALYGANAFVGVVNIITRHPGEGPAAYARVGGGSGKQGLGTFIASGRSGRLGYRLSGGYTQANKWSVDFAPDRSDYLSQVDDPNLALRTAKANGVLAVALAPGAELRLAGGVTKLYTEIYPLGLLRNDALDGVHLYAQSGLTAGPFQLRLFWNRLSASATPQYQAPGQRSLATTVITHILDAETQLAQGFRAAGEHRFTVGAGYRLKTGVWDYLGTSPVEHHFSAFAQEEYRPVPALAISGSLRVDRHPLLDAGQPGFAISPRASAVWGFAEGQALHAAVGTAFREPTFVESYTHLLVPVPNQPSVAVLTLGNTGLKPERVFSAEVGYRVEFAAAQLDLTAYRNEVRDLIELSGLAPVSAGATYDDSRGAYVAGQSSFINDSPVYTALGGELGVKASPVDRLGLRGALAVEQITASGIDAARCGPCNEVPAVKVYGGASYRTAFKLDLNLDASYVTSTTWIERAPDPANPTQVAFSAFPLAAYAVVDARLGYRFLDDHLEAGVQGTNLAAAHQEHPFGNRVETRVLATLAGSL